MSENKLLSAPKASESKNKIRIEKIREKVKKLQHEFSKPEIKEIKKNLYKIEKTEKYLLELE